MASPILDVIPRINHDRDPQSVQLDPQCFEFFPGPPAVDQVEDCRKISMYRNMLTIAHLFKCDHHGLEFSANTSLSSDGPSLGRILPNDEGASRPFPLDAGIRPDVYLPSLAPDHCCASVTIPVSV